MTPKPTAESRNNCTQNGAVELESKEASGPLPACISSTAQSCSRSASRVGVFASGDDFRGTPRSYVSRGVADAYPESEVARSVNRGKDIVLTRKSPEFAPRDLSARMSPQVTERAAEGCKRARAITAAWQPRAKGAHHAQSQKPMHLRRQTNLQPLLDAHAVADHLGVDPRTLRGYVDTGALPAVRLPSGHLRFRQEVLQRFIAGAETNSSI